MKFMRPYRIRIELLRYIADQRPLSTCATAHGCGLPLTETGAKFVLYERNDGKDVEVWEVLRSAETSVDFSVSVRGRKLKTGVVVLTSFVASNRRETDYARRWLEAEFTQLETYS